MVTILSQFSAISAGADAALAPALTALSTDSALKMNDEFVYSLGEVYLTS